MVGSNPPTVWGFLRKIKSVIQPTNEMCGKIMIRIRRT